jgi:hypothetical protein
MHLDDLGRYALIVEDQKEGPQAECKRQDHNYGEKGFVLRH